MKSLRPLFLLLLIPLAVALSSCATAGGGPSPLSDLKEATLADAQLGLQWATEDKDPIAATCWQAIADILKSAPAQGTGRNPVGVISTSQLARGVRHKIEGVSTSELRTKFLIGCAPLGADERDLMIRLGLKILPLVP